jgi:hypothetical protein
MKNIASALVKAQKAFGPALKSSTNPHFKSKYADLAACVEAVIDGLNANGIFLAQVCHESADGVIVETQLIHESGESFSAGKLHVPASKQDPQGYGSALTYARRYSLMAACGIAPEDDDGNAAKAKESKLGGAIPGQVLRSIKEPLTEDQKRHVEDSLKPILDAYEVGGPQGGFERLQQENFDDMQKIYLSTLMDSKVRNSIKAYSHEYHSKAKATA